MLTARDALARLRFARTRAGGSGGGGLNGERITLKAPPIAEFQRVFRHVRTGQSLRPGVAGVGSRERETQVALVTF